MSATLREVIARLKAGDITLADVAEHLRHHAVDVRQPAKTIAESYARAEEMPTDNDTFWIGTAFFDRTINDAEYEFLLDVVRDHGIVNPT